MIYYVRFDATQNGIVLKDATRNRHIRDAWIDTFGLGHCIKVSVDVREHVIKACEPMFDDFVVGIEHSFILETLSQYSPYGY